MSDKVVICGNEIVKGVMNVKLHSTSEARNEAKPSQPGRQQSRITIMQVRDFRHLRSGSKRKM